MLLDKGHYNVTRPRLVGTRARQESGRVLRRRAQLADGAPGKPGAAEVPDALQHLAGCGTASPAILQSRATDETGYVQPKINQLRAVRGTRSVYHNNAIQSWKVAADGETSNVQVG